MSPSRPFACLLVAAALIGCAGAGGRSEYEKCLAEHRGSVEATQVRRIGWYSRELALAFDVGRPPPNTPLVVRELAGKCAGRVSVRTPTRTYENGPFLHVDSYHVPLGGKRLAYVGSLERSVYVVVDGVASPPYRRVHAVDFSRDGAHAGYLADEGAEVVLVVDGTVRFRSAKILPDIFRLLDDGRAIVTVGEPAGGVRVQVGDARGPLFDSIDWRSVVVDERGARHAYVGRRGGVARMVVDGQEIDAPCAGERVTFSDDGRHFAFFAGPTPEAPAGVVVDGHLHRAERASSLFFVGDGHVVAHGVADEAGDERVEIVGARTPTPRPTSDDYRPREGVKGQRLVLGASVGPLFDQIHLDTIRIEADGTVRYEGSRDEVRRRVVDGVIQPR